MLGVEVLFRVPPAAGLSLKGSGAGGGGDMTQLSLVISCFFQFSGFAATEKNNTSMYH
jgi:hypothetical protein